MVGNAAEIPKKVQTEMDPLDLIMITSLIVLVWINCSGLNQRAYMKYGSVPELSIGNQGE